MHDPSHQKEVIHRRTEMKKIFICRRKFCWWGRGNYCILEAQRRFLVSQQSPDTCCHHQCSGCRKVQMHDWIHLREKKRLKITKDFLDQMRNKVKQQFSQWKFTSTHPLTLQNDGPHLGEAEMSPLKYILADGVTKSWIIQDLKHLPEGFP